MMRLCGWQCRYSDDSCCYRRRVFFSSDDSAHNDPGALLARLVHSGTIGRFTVRVLKGREPIPSRVTVLPYLTQ